MRVLPDSLDTLSLSESEISSMAALETDQSVGCLTFASNLSNIVINYIGK